MIDNPKSKVDRASSFSQQIGKKAARKLKAQHRPIANAWFGLGIMGLVGWSIVVPTLAGAALGAWLDRVLPRNQSWTLMLMIAGLLLGCFNAWTWVAKEDKAMHAESNEELKDDE